MSSGAGDRSRCLEGHGPLEAPGDCGVGDGQQGPSSRQQAAPLTSRATMGTSVHCPCLRSQAVTWGLTAERGLHE